MSTHKHIDCICVVAVVLTIIISVALMIGGVKGVGAAQGANSADGQVVEYLAGQKVNSAMFAAEDLQLLSESKKNVNIQLNDKKNVISGSGVYTSGKDVVIATAGDYVISGSLSDGSIVVEAGKEDVVRILLQNVSIHREDGAAIYVKQARKVILTLGDGTENTISSGEISATEVQSSLTAETAAPGAFSDAAKDSTEESEDSSKAAIVSKDDLTINGSGKLQVIGASKHAIVGKDNLVIAGGELEIQAIEDGIHANDSVRICNADISIAAGDDGITVSNDAADDYLYIESGKIQITECYEGMEATQIMIDGGDISIWPQDDGINATSNSDGLVRINGGQIRIINPNGRDADGIDSNRDIEINGGNVFVYVSNESSNVALDFGSENGGTCKINGGNVIACGGSGMLEAISDDSQQGFIMKVNSAQADTEIVLLNENGDVMLSDTAACSFGAIVISAEGMKVGDTCTLQIGDSAEEIVVDNSSAGSGFGGFRGGFNGGKGFGESGEVGGNFEKGHGFGGGFDSNSGDDNKFGGRDFGQFGGGEDSSQIGGGRDFGQFGGGEDSSQIGGGKDFGQFGGGEDSSQFGAGKDFGQFGGGEDPSQIGGGEDSSEPGGGEDSSEPGGGRDFGQFGGGEDSSQFGGGRDFGQFGGGEDSNQFGGGKDFRRSGEQGDSDTTEDVDRPDSPDMQQGGRKNFNNFDGMTSPEEADNLPQIWIGLGLSVIVLAAALLIVIKKKY